MASSTGIFELTAAPTAAADVLVFVDVSDASEAPQGSTRKVTLTNLYRTEGTPVTVSTPLPDIRQAWNAGGVAFTAAKVNVTDTASAAASLLLDLQVGGVSKFAFKKDGTLTCTTLVASLTGNVTGNVTGNLTGNVTGNVTGSVTGNAGTATALQTARTINGVSFDGTANITVAAAAGTLTGTTLAAGVVTSSLTSVGVLAAPHMTAAVVDSGGLTVTAGGVTATGNSSITGTLVVSSTINGQTISSAANLTGTLAVASTINGQTVSGAANFTGTLAVASTINGQTVSSVASLTGSLAVATTLVVGTGATVTTGNMQLTDGTLLLNQGGAHQQRIGSVLLVGGTALVFTSIVTANSKIFLSRQVIGGTTGTLTYTLSVGTGFTINSSSGTDTSTIVWVLIESV